VIYLSTVQRVAKNTGIVIVGNVIFRLVSLVVTIYLARYLGTVGFGKYSFVFAYLAFFDVILDLGLQIILVRDISRDPSNAPKLFGNAFIIRLILTIFAVALSIVLITLMSYPRETTTYIYIATFTLLFLSFSEFYVSIFQANLRMEYDIIAKLVFKFLSAGLILWIIFSQGTLMQVIIALVFSEMVKTLISYSFSRKFVKPRFAIDFGLWKYLFKEALPLALSNIIWVIYYRIDVVMLSIMMGDAEVGLYSAAYKLAEPFSLIPLALMVSLFPIMSASFKTSKEGLVKSYRLSFKYLLIITLPIAIGVSILSDKFIFLIYGAEFSGSAIALKILIWGLVFSSGTSIFWNVFVSTGKQKLGTYITALSAFGNITLNFSLIPLMSYVGASIASLLTAFLAFIIGFYFVSRNLRVPPLHKISMKPVVGSLIMGTFVYFFIDSNIFVLILCAAVIYLIFLLLLKTFTEEDIEVLERLTGRDMHWILNWKCLIDFIKELFGK
jgi:O-antigen/teichoic acid export membrane protein